MNLDGNQTQIEKRFDLLCRSLVEARGLEIYDLEYKDSSGLLRLIIQDSQTGGASLDDCVKIDRALDIPLQKESWIPERLTLEVSSPGLDRLIKTRKHIDQSVGKRVVIKMKEGYVKGILETIEGDSLLVEEGSRRHVVPLSSIREARWDFRQGEVR